MRTLDGRTFQARIVQLNHPVVRMTSGCFGVPRLRGHARMRRLPRVWSTTIAPRKDGGLGSALVERPE